ANPPDVIIRNREPRQHIGIVRVFFIALDMPYVRLGSEHRRNRLTDTVAPHDVNACEPGEEPFKGGIRAEMLHEVVGQNLRAEYAVPGYGTGHQNAKIPLAVEAAELCQQLTFDLQMFPGKAS